MKKLLAFVLAAAAAVSCIYPFNPEVQEESGSLVVEGDITPGQMTTIQLRYTHALGDVAGANTDEVDARVWVESSNGARYDGVRSATAASEFEIDMTSASMGHDYALHIEANGKTYHTEMMSVARAPIISQMNYVLDEEDVTLTATFTGSDVNRAYKISYKEIWEFHSDYRPTVLFVTEPREGYQDIPEDTIYENYFCWARGSSKELVLGDAYNTNVNRMERYPFAVKSRTSKRFQILYCVDVDVRAVTDEEYEYLKNLNASSNGSGDLFSPTPSSMPGNIVCDQDPDENVMGWVGVAQPATSRLMVDCSKAAIYRGRLPRDSEDLFIPDTSEQPLSWYYNMGYMPVGLYTVNFVEDIYWASASCVDCRKAGGTKNKPDFWPNDHF